MSGSDREVVIRHYALPEGKLDALLELMIREDVPVRVARVDGRIEVHAPESQQRVIEAFIHIIHPDGRPQQRRPRGQSSTNEMPGDPTVRAEVIAVPESSLDPLRSRVREHELEIRNLGRQAAEMEIRREELARAATDAEVRARSGLQERRERQLRNLEARTERARTTQEAEMLEQERLKFEQEMWNEELKLDERLQLERQQAENASRAIEQDRRRIELEMQALNDQMQAVQLEIERLQALRDEMRATYNMASP